MSPRVNELIPVRSNIKFTGNPRFQFRIYFKKNGSYLKLVRVLLTVMYTFRNKPVITSKPNGWTVLKNNRGNCYHILDSLEVISKLLCWHNFLHIFVSKIEIFIFEVLLPNPIFSQEFWTEIQCVLWKKNYACITGR